VYFSDKGFKGKKGVRINGVKFNAVPMRFDNRLLRCLKPFSRNVEPNRPLFATSLYYLGYILNIALRLRKEQCDIVHIHNFSQFIPIIRALNPNIKIALHMHCEWLTQIDQDIIERRLKKTDLIISCSEYITQKTRLAFPEFANRCHTVYNGIDVYSFVHVLLDAFEMVFERFPELDLQLIGPHTPAPLEYIVTLSDDPKVLELSTFYSGDYLSHLKKKISADLVNNVTFYKHIPYSNLTNFYHSAHLFVFPSVWDEPFGMPIIEAMACGLPVVATRGGGIPEIIENGKTGLLVERGDAGTLAEAIVSLIQDQPLRDSIGNAGRQSVLKRFTWDRISEDLVSTYGKLFF